MITFIEHPVFTKRIEEVLSPEEYRQFQKDLAANPDSGDVIQGLSGLRKIRVAISGKGKRGGARVLYLLFLKAETVYMVYVYTKGDFDDLPTDKRRVMKRLVDEIKKEFEQ